MKNVDDLTSCLKPAITIIASAFLLAACSPKTSDGVSYEKKSDGELTKVCKGTLEDYVEAVRLGGRAPKKDINRAIKSCCKGLKETTRKFSAEQKAATWYSLQRSRDLTLSRNEVEAASRIREALLNDLPTPERLEVIRAKSSVSICMAQSF
ncbi:hypothetical protein HK107_10740 [Parvularcula sp. ZS-1/3]|uniref:Lipoprotein n=1 Tax=Parvularcula mediterranea TaxID=2732508 RepID=A0A7Y3W5N0_9PROT|nr:hypothetical protein [Parvularcula mediterranea]NNU16794.1 hypothetical protein [Parvularcula mediterranea]